MNVNEINAHSFKIGAATSTFVNRKSEEIKIWVGGHQHALNFTNLRPHKRY